MLKIKIEGIHGSVNGLLVSLKAIIEELERHVGAGIPGMLPTGQYVAS